MDIPEKRRQAENAVRLSEIRYRRLFESAKDGILILDADTARITDANPFISELLDYTHDELIGKELWQIGLFRDAEASRAAVQELQESHYIRYEDLPLETKSGRRIDVEFVSNVYTEDHDSVIQCNIRDITERKRTEDELRSSRERYRVLFDLGPVAIFSCNRDGVLQDYNLRAAELWGREPACGDNGQRYCGSLRLLRPDGRPLPHAQSPIVEVLRSGVIARDVDVVIERPDGSRISVVVTFAPLVNEHGEVTGAITAFYDITEHKRLEEDLAKRNEELAAADDEKNRYLAVLAHELRSPLNAIRGWIQILRRSDAKEDDLRRGLEVIDRNSKAQAQLIEDLLDVQRIAAGKVRLELARVDLREVVDSVVEAMTPAAAEKDLRIDPEIDPAPVLVSADATRLEQVLGNLLSNAIKFTPKGGQIRVALRRTPTRAELCVSDTGQGISPQALSHIFERFRQADPLTSRDQGGLGLGLAISKQLVELHAGTISVDSAGRDQGSTFTVSLPLRLADAAHLPALAERATGSQPASLEGIVVLVVDDEPDTREPLRRVLEEAGADAMVVGSADEALDAIRQRRPDVIVSDIGMPGRDGYDLLRAIRALPPKRGGRTPAIALTAYASAEDRDRTLRADFAVHLAKPADPSELIAAVAALAPLGKPGTRAEG